MKQIAFWAPMIFIAMMADQARSADNSILALENCFKASRLADSICSNPQNSPQQRIACYQKAQAAQLSCLEHIAPDVTASTPSTDTTGVVTSQAAVSPPETSVTAVQAPAPAAPPAAAAPEAAPAAAAPDAAPGAVAPNAAPAAVTPEAAPAAVAPAVPAATPRTDTADKNPDPPPAKPSGPDWVVTETTSPIDYSPVIIATIRSSDGRQDAPNALSIQCRQRRPEISLRTDGAWKIAPNNKVLVGLQMKDRAPWNLSADGKVATTADRANELLQSLSEGMTLMVTVSDGADHAAAFRLAGLDAVRKKVMTACRPAPVIDSKASLVKR